jgi:hypothetical protein
MLSDCRRAKRKRSTMCLAHLWTNTAAPLDSAGSFPHRRCRLPRPAASSPHHFIHRRHFGLATRASAAGTSHPKPHFPRCRAAAPAPGPFSLQASDGSMAVPAAFGLATAVT